MTNFIYIHTIYYEIKKYYTPRSSRGLGHRPFTAKTRVRNPSGVFFFFFQNLFRSPGEMVDTLVLGTSAYGVRVQLPRRALIDIIVIILYYIFFTFDECI